MFFYVRSCIIAKVIKMNEGGNMETSKEKIIGLSNQIYMDLSEEETEKLCRDVGQIVEETKILNEVDVSNIKGDVSVLSEQYNSFRKDEVVEYKDKEGLLKNASEVEQGMFKIPKIV